MSNDNIAKPTAGKWSGRSSSTPILLQGAEKAGLSLAFACGGGDPRREEYIANCRLIAEAGDVLDETGLTPRQLADDRIALLDAAKRIIAAGDATIHGAGNDIEVMLEFGAADHDLRAIIAKVEAKP